jgi:hypothetical protein
MKCFEISESESDWSKWSLDFFHPRPWTVDVDEGWMARLSASEKSRLMNILSVLRFDIFFVS